MQLRTWHYIPEDSELHTRRRENLKSHKVKLSCYRHAGAILILDLIIRWGWVVSVTPQPYFTLGERTPGTNWIGGWVGLRAGLDTEARGKILFLFRRWNPGRPVIQSLVRHYADWATPAPRVEEYILQILTYRRLLFLGCKLLVHTQCIVFGKLKVWW
jgi:hypothetical protein